MRDRLGRFMKGMLGKEHPRWSRKEVKCVWCGKELLRTASQRANCKRAFCNLKHKGKWQSVNCLGKDSSHYGHLLSEESKEKNRIAHLGMHRGGVKKGNIPWNKNKKGCFSNRTIVEMQRSHLGQPSSMKGKHFSEEVVEHNRQAQKLHFQNPGAIQVRKDAQLKKWRDENYREKQMKAILRGNRIKPNKAELRLFSILQKYFPGDYALNVKAEVMILGGKIPDFVNVNGQKKVIELYGDYHHQDEKLENGGDGGRKREEIFAKCGFETLIVWEHELLNEDLLFQKLTRFKFVRRKHSHHQN